MVGLRLRKGISRDVWFGGAILVPVRHNRCFRIE